jgi:YbgC/YbaW family acyl-CoA thioester hydrolase
MAHEFRRRRKVYWQDTDAAGIIHFSNYFRYMEETETEFYDSLGIPAREILRQDGIVLVRVSAGCDFEKSVTFGDELDIHVWVARKGRSSVSYGISFEHDGQQVAHGRWTIVSAKRNPDGAMGSIPLPEVLGRQLEVAPFATSTQVEP